MVRPYVVRSESKLLPVMPKPERLPKRWDHVTTPSVKISEILETDNITIVNRPLVVKDAKSESMSRYFEDVTMKEVEHVSGKAVDAIMRRFRNLIPKLEEKNENKSSKEKGNDNHNNNSNGKKYIGDDGEAEEITRNVKIIEGLDSNGRLF